MGWHEVGQIFKKFCPNKSLLYSCIIFFCKSFTVHSYITKKGHGGRVVTHSPPTSEAGAFYSTEP